MKSKAMTFLKVLSPIVTIGGTLLANYYADKKQEEIIAKKVSEEFTKLNKRDA